MLEHQTYPGKNQMLLFCTQIYQYILYIPGLLNIQRNKTGLAFFNLKEAVNATFEKN